ncbi:quercetin 2,3-dioxygenase [candidate division GN15 bacterium]|uniref:Quercetin 2,3-dioxygenase n=1 Tax=candidate division GN15 bacterium TaxID=2072418 RepID=A0A855X9R6_9BACT|nr:MAG: quercetin 2,3-dioxygenase [candidate division GN15 bacterium]
MIIVRKGRERGHLNHGWLDTYHTFSFAGYYDPRHVRFRSLRVINEDRVAPGQGFPPHDHRDMEIITVVLEGALEHKDSMGNGSIIRAGDIQRMSAGTGVTHSEFNASKSELVHLLQIWVHPDQLGYEPSYEQQTLPVEERRGRLQLLASPDGADKSVTIHQDVKLYTSRLPQGKSLVYDPRRGRHAWLQMIEGKIYVNDVALVAGDGTAVSEVATLRIQAESESEFLLFDLA